MGVMSDVTSFLEKALLQNRICLMHDFLLVCSLSVLQLQRDSNLGKISQDAYSQQAVEILTALRKLGESVRYISRAIDS